MKYIEIVMKCNDMQWNNNEILWNTITYNEIQWNSNNIQWNTMK